MKDDFIANPNRELIRTIDGQQYLRIPVKTGVIKSGENLFEIIETFLCDKIQKNDIVVISESVLAICQGRAIPVSQIKPGFLARILWRGVRKVPYGIGLRSPESMQCAINEAGAFRILLASTVGFLSKLVGRRGDFYRIAGKQAATIDAATTSPVAEFHDCVIMGPKDPDGFCRELTRKIKVQSAVVDVNDIGGSWVLGASEEVDRQKTEDIMRDNPLGQANELTPVGIIRIV
jgi:F420-0:Gamma-glutamyl ligase